MYAVDFEYDGELLSDKGYIICDFNGSDGFQNVSFGSKMEFTTTAMHNGLKNYITGMNYSDVAECEFGICKNPDVFNQQNMHFTDNEIRNLVRWLSRPSYHKFQIIYDDNYREPSFYNCTFEIEIVTHLERPVGLEVTMIADSPFAYGIERTYSYTLTAGQSKIIPDVSDLIGSVYPDVTITLNESGTFTWENEMTGSYVQVDNCSEGEVLKFTDGLIIQSSLSTHDLSKDFNYDFPKIGNTYKDRRNKITVGLGCKMVLTYTPFIKNVP